MGAGGTTNGADGGASSGVVTIPDSPRGRRLLAAVPGRSWALGALAAAALVALLVGGMSASRSATTGMLVSQLRLAVEGAEPALPRIRMHDHGATYWVPNVASAGDNPAFLQVYEGLLIDVNQNTLPLCLLSPVSLVPIGDDAIAMTTATCAGFLGRTWSTLITAYVPLRRYASK